MLKMLSFARKKVLLNKIKLKNGCLEPVDNGESFQEKKYRKNIDFSSKKSWPKKGLMRYHPFIDSPRLNLPILIIFRFIK